LRHPQSKKIKKSGRGGYRKGAGRKPKLKPGRAWCLYIIGEVHEGPCKIGYTQHLSTRICNLQTSNWRELICYAAFELPSQKDAETVEAKVHDAFSSDRVRGEWYNISAPDLIVMASTIIEKIGLNLTETTNPTRSFVSKRI
jgi:hypothetical protein